MTVNDKAENDWLTKTKVVKPKNPNGAMVGIKKLLIG